MEGIQRTKEKGVYQGDKKKINSERIITLYKAGPEANAIASKLDVIKIVIISYSSGQNYEKVKGIFTSSGLSIADG